MLADARELIRRHRVAVERVAHALLDRGTLTASEIDRLMEASIPSLTVPLRKGAAPTSVRPVQLDHDLIVTTSETVGRDRAARHSITSSARSSIDGGIARPSALAVLRFTTMSNLVENCSSRRSAAANSGGRCPSYHGR
jgi:hypothetical protein